MQSRRNILLVGAAGSGKTWVMKQLIASMSGMDMKSGLIDAKYDPASNILVLGKYDGTTFEGGDRLSMAVARDFQPLADLANSLGATIIAEGDRFMNGKFINIFAPYIIKIENDGSEGIALRGSSQTERHLKAIKTRVANIDEDIIVANSTEALKRIEEII